jgi:alpha-L-fucosidase
VNAFRKEGIKVGFYYSLIDWNHPDFTIDGTHPQRGDAEFRKVNASRDQSKYAAYMRNQVTELLTQFGKIDILWFDFSYPGPEGKGHKDWESEKLLTLVRKLQPHVLIDNRLDIPNSGDFDTPEQHQPAEAPKDGQGNVLPWEGCQTFSGSWGYHRDELTWKSLNTLLWMLIDGVSKGGNLLLNVGPTSRGEIDYRAMDRLDGIGKWMHHHSRAIYGCGQAPAGLVAPTGCRYTYNPKTHRLYLHMFEWAFNELFVDGLKDIIDYSQFLHDGSEVIWRARDEYGPVKKRIAFILPHVKPNVEIPVIEILLKK